ncbi:hypothetical protein ES332_D01G000200v1 [Gossypium tomentosum]|uniref:Uncharacterized protein n=1 Tax=Gossypium tomentosum TaxID=34277 RepID=A0A5D2M3L8_GOSTO|nr:hypothetical protein ES332_D01G000200v1 [Gossypium tomentosum]
MHKNEGFSFVDVGHSYQPKVNNLMVNNGSLIKPWVFSCFHAIFFFISGKYYYVIQKYFWDVAYGLLDEDIFQSLLHERHDTMKVVKSVREFGSSKSFGCI